MRGIWAIALTMIKELVRRKDFYVLFIFLLVIMGVLASQNFFHIEGISRYLRDLGYSMVMLLSFIIAVTFTAKQIPAELEAKTIYPLLAKPVSRSKVITGKYAGGAAVSIIAFTLFYGVYALFYVTGGDAYLPALLVQGYLFGVMFLLLATAMVIFFSNFMTTSANITVSFLLYIMITGFSGTLRDAIIYSKGLVSVLEGALYYLLPHFDFYDLRIRLAHSWDPLAGWVVCSVVIYTLIYCSFLLYFAGVIFRRRRL